MVVHGGGGRAPTGYGATIGAGWDYSSGKGGVSNLAFMDVSYTIPSGLFSRKKGKIVLDSVR